MPNQDEIQPLHRGVVLHFTPALSGQATWLLSGGSTSCDLAQRANGSTKLCAPVGC
jgi:hypothetical protein